MRVQREACTADPTPPQTVTVPVLRHITLLRAAPRPGAVALIRAVTINKLRRRRLPIERCRSSASRTLGLPPSGRQCPVDQLLRLSREQLFGITEVGTQEPARRRH